MEESNKEKISIIYKRSAEVCSFYLLDNAIYYKILCNNQSNSEEKLIENVRDYDISIDSKDTVHLVCITFNGELYYLSNINNKWDKKLLKKIYVQPKDIHPLILVITKKVLHIFFTYKDTAYNNYYRILYLYFNGANWKYDYIHSIETLPNKNITPFLLDHDIDRNIYLVLKSFKSKKFNFTLQTYSTINKNWTVLRKKITNIDIKDIKAFYVDSMSNFHFIYIKDEKIKNLYHISFNENKIISQTLLNQEPIENINYNIYELSETLWLTWKDNGKIYYRTSRNFGKNWSKIKKLDIKGFFEIKYIGKVYEGKKLYKDISTFGYFKNNAYYLLGLDDINKFKGSNSILGTKKQSQNSLTISEDNTNNNCNICLKGFIKVIQKKLNKLVKYLITFYKNILNLLSKLFN